MILCDKTHDEICYEGNWKTECPFCKMIKEKDGEIEGMKKVEEDLIGKIENLENELEEIKGGE